MPIAHRVRGSRAGVIRDPWFERQKLHDLAALLRRTGTTALMVTHDLTEAATIADRTLSLPARS